MAKIQLKNTLFFKYNLPEDRVSSPEKRQSFFRNIRLLTKGGSPFISSCFVQDNRSLILGHDKSHCPSFQFGLLGRRRGCVFITAKAMIMGERGTAKGSISSLHPAQPQGGVVV